MVEIRINRLRERIMMCFVHCCTLTARFGTPSRIIVSNI